jgi:hypothetical protein
MMADKEIRVLRDVSENLLCVLYVIISAAVASSDNRQIDAWRNDIKECLKYTEKHPTQSFFGQLSRWIQDKINE